MSDGRLGAFDTTVIPDGLYQLRLTVTANDGQERAVDGPIVDVVGQFKVGNMRFSVVDLAVPVLGIPVSIVRSYDNFRRAGGDFGYDWTEGIKTVDLQQNRCYIDIVVTLPTSREPLRFIFDPTYSDYSVDGYNVYTPHWDHDPVSGATLSVPDDGTLLSQDERGCWVNDDVIGSGDHSDYAPSTLYVTTADGTRFVIDNTGDSATSRLTEVDEPNGAVLYYGADGVRSNRGVSIAISRDSQGRIAAVTDPMGKSIAYSYDTAGDLHTMTDRDGGATTYTYDGRHNLLSQKDPTGRTPAIAHYDDRGRLTGITNADGTTVAVTTDPAARQQVTTDARGNITVSKLDAQGNVTQVTDPLGHIRDYSFDSTTGRVTSYTNAAGIATTYGYDAYGRRDSYSNPVLGARAATYDAQGRLLDSTLNGLGQGSVRYDALGYVRQTTNALGQTWNVSNTLQPDGARLFIVAGPTGVTTTQTLDARGLLQGFADTAGHATRYLRDADGRVTAETTDGITTTAYTYDAQGNLLSESDAAGALTRIAYDAADRPVTETNPLGYNTVHRYDEMGQPSTTTYPDGSHVSQSYDPNGRVQTRTDANGAVTRFVYDAANHHTETDYPDGGKEYYQPDAIGRTVAQTDALGQATYLGYDTASRVVTATNALGETSTNYYDPRTALRTSATDPTGHSTYYTYDRLGRLTATTATVTMNGIGAVVGATTGYNALGATDVVTDANGDATRFGYDIAGQLITVTNPLGQSAHYDRDGHGNIVTQWDANSHYITYTYTLDGRVQSLGYADGSTDNIRYDAAGNPVWQQIARSPSGAGAVIASVYDAMDRPAQVRYPDIDGAGGHTVDYGYYPGGQQRAVTDTATGGAPRTTGYAIDVMGRTTAITEPDGAVLRYTYDVAGRRTGVQTIPPGASAPSSVTGYGYDALGRLAVVTDTVGGVTAYTYDSRSNLATHTLPNGVRTTYGYDELNRLVDLRAVGVAGATLWHDVYTLDAVGRRTGVSETDAAGAVTAYGYTYDAAGRLTGETQTRGTSSLLSAAYGYDAVGNRTVMTATDGITTYAYDAAGRDELTLVSGPGGTRACTYDRDGNMSACTGGGVVTSYTYDAQDRLLAVGTERQGDLSGGSYRLVARYTYDAAGNRTSATDAAGHVTTYLVDPLAPDGLPEALQESTDGGAPTTYTYGLERVGMQRGGASYYYLYDGHGDVRAVVDAAGAVQDSYRYDSFGRTLAAGGDVPNSYRYDGQQYDAATGLYDLRARYMDPTTGRFLSVDPLPGSPDDPASLHRYLYAGDDPVQIHDPTGQEGEMTGTLMSTASMARFMAASMALYLVTQTLVREEARRAIIDEIDAIGRRWETPPEPGPEPTPRIDPIPAPPTTDTSNDDGCPTDDGGDGGGGVLPTYCVSVTNGLISPGYYARGPVVSTWHSDQYARHILNAINGTGPGATRTGGRRQSAALEYDGGGAMTDFRGRNRGQRRGDATGGCQRNSTWPSDPAAGPKMFRGRITNPECDEYPFASTLQGGTDPATVPPPLRRVSDVLLIDAEHNQAGGQDISAFYRTVLHTVNGVQSPFIVLATP